MAHSKIFFPKRFSSHSSHVDIQPVADFAFVLSLLFFSSMSMTLMAASGILVPGGGKNNFNFFYTHYNNHCTYLSMKTLFYKNILELYTEMYMTEKLNHLLSLHPLPPPHSPKKKYAFSYQPMNHIACNFCF